MIRSAFTLIARSFALICVLLFIIVSLAILILYNIDHYLLAPETYKLALSEHNLYERAPELAAKQLEYQIEYSDSLTERPEDEPDETRLNQTDGLPEMIRNLSSADIEQIISTLLPADILQDQMESAIDVAFSVLYDEGQDEPGAIHLDELKSRIAGEEGVRAVRQFVQAQPACEKSGSNPLDCDDMIDGMTVCKPPEQVFESCIPEIRIILREGTASIPEVITFGQLTGTGVESEDRSSADDSSSADEGLIRVRQVINLIPLIILLGLYSLATLTLLISLSAVRSIESLLRWLGVPILVVGLIILVVVGGMLPLSTWAADRYLIGNLPSNLAPNMVQVLLDLGRSILRGFASSAGIQAAIITLVGLAMVVGATLLRRRSALSPGNAENLFE